jgi:ABC-type transport system involved in multi-copper enzyme maturation permease subunit
VNRLAELKKFLQEAPWQMWTAQVAAILSVELKRNLSNRRSVWLYVLALAPVLLVGAHALHSPMGIHCSLEGDTNALAGIFQFFYLRLGIFFGCMGLFTWLFRGEMVHKSLHYYFLAPMRREVLVVGKFLSGLVTAGLFFSLSILLCFALMYGHCGQRGLDYVLHGPGLGQLVDYLGVTLLACLGYGAIFVTLSLFIKNPIIPGGFVLLWETFHPVFPALLQKFSVMFYLRQLCPVPVLPEGLMSLFTVIVEPVSPWIAVPGLVCLSLIILAVACLKIRRMEISYLAE